MSSTNYINMSSESQMEMPTISHILPVETPTGPPVSPASPFADAIVENPEPTPIVENPDATPIVADPDATPIIADPEAKPTVADPDATPIVADPEATPIVADPNPVIKPSVTDPEATPKLKQMVQIKINRVNEKDLVGIHQLQNQCFKGGEAYSLEVIQMLYQSCPFQFVAVTEPEETVVGFLITMPSCEWKDMVGLTIASFAVHESLRGSGLGKALLSTCLQITDNLTIDHPMTGKKIAPDVVLQVRTSNAKAIKLYQQMGFLKDHDLLKDYYSDPVEDAYIMYKRGQPINEEVDSPKPKSPTRILSELKSPPVKKSRNREDRPSDWNNYLIWGLTGISLALTSFVIGVKLMRGGKSDSK